MIFDRIQVRPAEHAWIAACKRHDATRGCVPAPLVGQLEHLTLTALDRCIFMGWMTAEQYAVLGQYGAIGPPNRTEIDTRRLWDSAIDVLEAEMNRMVFSAPDPRVRAGGKFFYGPHGTPFMDAANAWWWTLDCLDARHGGGRENSGLRVGRPCEPDDVVNALRRLDLPPTHARTIMAWGKKRDTPPKGTAARQYWDEVMDRLTIVLREKGIIALGEPGTSQTLDALMAAFGPVPVTAASVPLDALEGEPAPVPRRRPRAATG
jgi:hypothetical protein